MSDKLAGLTRGFLWIGVLCVSRPQSLTTTFFFIVMELGFFGIGCLECLVVCPESVSSFGQLCVRGSGRGKDASMLWECGMFAVLWSTWIERNLEFLGIRWCRLYFGIEWCLWLCYRPWLGVLLEVSPFQRRSGILEHFQNVLEVCGSVRKCRLHLSKCGLWRCSWINAYSPSPPLDYPRLEKNVIPLLTAFKYCMGEENQWLSLYNSNYCFCFMLEAACSQ